MIMNMTQFLTITLLTLSSLSELSLAADTLSLDQLLKKTRRDHQLDKAINSQREAIFLKEKNRRQQLLDQAIAQLEAEKARGNSLKKSFDENEKNLAELEKKLSLTMGTFGELFGVVRQVAGDTKGGFENSIISAQKPGRIKFLKSLAERKELAKAQDLEKLWISILEEMVESGKVTSFKRPVTGKDGREKEQLVTRVGTFNLTSMGLYLDYLPEVGKAVVLPRQPQGRYLGNLETFQKASPETLAAFSLDPTRGSLMSLLVQSPDLGERIQQGGIVGYLILTLLLMGILLVCERFLYLSRIGIKMKKQIRDGKNNEKTPLTTIIHAYEVNKSRDIETLELKLEEAMIKSTAKVERGINIIKIFATVAPLLGLLGTVTGMIVTFQSITLFGTGDPKLMAGGISQALVTTVLGLIAAIPLLLLHSIVSSKSKVILKFLEEQSVGLIVRKTEDKEA